MYFLYIILLILVLLLVSKKKTIETGYWGPWGYSDKYEWLYPDKYRVYIPFKKKYTNRNIYLPYEYWL